MLQKQMIVALQSNETGIRDALGQLQSPAVRNASVVTAVKDQSGHTHLAQPMTNVDCTQRFLEANCVLGRSGDPHELVHPANLLRRAIRNERGSENLAECRIVLAPSM